MSPGLEILSCVHSQYPIPTRMDESICIKEINVLICFVQCLVSLRRLSTLYFHKPFMSVT